MAADTFIQIKSKCLSNPMLRMEEVSLNNGDAFLRVHCRSRFVMLNEEQGPFAAVEIVVRYNKDLKKCSASIQVFHKPSNVQDLKTPDDIDWYIDRVLDRSFVVCSGIKNSVEICEKLGYRPKELRHWYHPYNRTDSLSCMLYFQPPTKSSSQDPETLNLCARCRNLLFTLKFRLRKAKSRSSSPSRGWKSDKQKAGARRKKRSVSPQRYKARTKYITKALKNSYLGDKPVQKEKPRGGNGFPKYNPAQGGKPYYPYVGGKSYSPPYYGSKGLQMGKPFFGDKPHRQREVQIRHKTTSL